MMDRSRSQHAALGLPEDVTVWEAESTYTEAGLAAGAPTPTSSSTMALVATGPQSDDIRIRVQSGGVPDVEQGVRAIWRREDESTWYGWDPPFATTAWQPISMAASAPEYTRHPDVATTPDGGLVCVVDVRDSRVADEYQLVAYRWSASAGTWSAVVIQSQSSAPAQDRCPCIVALPSGRLLVYESIISGSTTRRQLRMWFSDDDGATWAFGGDRILDDSFDVPVVRMRAAYSTGQILLLIGTDDSGDYDVLQYASSDLGNTMQFVAAIGGAGPGNDARYADVCAALGRGFVIVVAGVAGSLTDASSYTIADAYRPFTAAAPVSLPPAFASISAATDSDLALCKLTDGSIVVYGRDATNDIVYGAVSYDSGTNWAVVEDDIVWRSGAATDDYPYELAVAEADGRVAMVHRWVTGTASWAADLAVMWLGGWASQTHRYYTLDQTDTQVLGWQRQYVPVELPQDNGWTAAGTGTELLAPDGEFVRIVTSPTQARTYTFSTTFGGDMAARMAVTPSTLLAGNEQLIVSTATYQVSARLGTTEWRLFDDLAGAQIGAVSANFADGIEVWIEIDDSAGYVQTWYRPLSRTEPAEWVAGPATGSLTSGLPTPQIVFGVVAPSASVMTVHHLWWDSANRRQFSQLPMTVPTILRGRTVSNTPYFGESVRLTARSGPAWRGDEWTIARRATYGLQQAVDVRSPRVPWRSASVAQQVIALQWDDEAQRTPSRVAALTLRGSNVERITVEYHDGSTWQSLGTAVLGLSGLQMTRSGRSLRPASGTDPHTMHHGEYAGGTAILDPGGVSEVAHRIASHTGGVWSDTHPATPTIRLEGDATSSPSSGGLTIVPEQVVVLVNLTGREARALRLTVPTAAEGPAETYWQIGAVTLHWLHPMGTEYAWGRVQSTEVGTEVSETRDGQVRAVQTHPARRSVSLDWQTVPQVEVEQTDLLAGYVTLGTTIDPTVLEQGTAYALDGYYQELDGDARPLLYLPSVPPLSGNLTVLRRRRDAIVGRVVSGAVQRTTQVGTEHEDELVSVGTIEIEEVI